MGSPEIEPCPLGYHKNTIKLLYINEEVLVIENLNLIYKWYSNDYDIVVMLIYGHDFTIIAQSPTNDAFHMIALSLQYLNNDFKSSCLI